ncbi:hypothetical protein KPA97_63375 [Burkholderia cenocepacia]|nr:hypothetical protein [Burkholderia cenocepacia]MDR5670663.1 hypothetical protein [Burkholderia cenocepacia]
MPSASVRLVRPMKKRLPTCITSPPSRRPDCIGSSSRYAQFLAARGTTPGAYRQFFKQHGHAPDGDAPALDTRPPSLERRTGSGQHRPPK